MGNPTADSLLYMLAQPASPELIIVLLAVGVVAVVVTCIGLVLFGKV